MPSEANLRAAREVVASRARHARGLHRTSSAGMTQPLSLRAACSRHPGSSVASIQRIVTRIETGFTPQQVGRPRVLTDEEDEAIVAFVIWMERSGFPASKPEIEDAAITLRQRRNPDADPVSKMWYARFRDDYPELDHNVSLQEIRDQQEEVIAEARQKEEKAQVRTARSLVIQEMKKIKDQWRQEKEITVDGVKKKASWSQWLEHTGKDIEKSTKLFITPVLPRNPSARWTGPLSQEVTIASLSSSNRLLPRKKKRKRKKKMTRNSLYLNLNCECPHRRRLHPRRRGCRLCHLNFPLRRARYGLNTTYQGYRGSRASSRKQGPHKKPARRAKKTLSQPNLYEESSRKAAALEA
ncbi:hypothetical protein MRS44_002036 [Fusarium solani]|uniref:uncharacterized protein n=1 Tax=Fusarium solani TaxID=169388 RepID=UPI0032C45F41|nr:hypothetical protein MRS44_002036 [Fusarium solani]